MQRSSKTHSLGPQHLSTWKAGSAYLKVNGDLASKAAVAMLLSNGTANPAQSSSVCVDNLELSVHLALILDGVLDLRVFQDLIVQARPIAVHLKQRRRSVMSRLRSTPAALLLQ